MDEADRNTSQEWKKSGRARKLNFGQGILTLDAVKRFQGQKDGALLLEWNVARVPCVAKEDFVRMWIEVHCDGVSDAKEKVCLSPILGSPRKPLQTSPVFGIQSKRVRNDGTLYSTEDDSSFATRKSKRIRIDSASSKENIRRNLFDSPSANVAREQNFTASSPILLRNTCSYKRRRRRLQKDNSPRKALNYIENKCTEEDAKFPMPYAKTGTLEQSPILDKNSYSCKRKRKQRRKKDVENIDTSRISFADPTTNFEALSNNNIFCSQKRQILIKKLENSLENCNSNSFVEEDSKISDGSVESHSPLSIVKLNIEDSPKDCMRDAGKIDIESSHENSHCSKETIDINNDTDQEFSDHIEDVDTQDMFPAITKDERVLKSSTKCAVFKSTSPHSQSSNKDSDQTFCLKAEQLGRSIPSVHSSQKISQISSQVIDNRDSRSSQSGIVISTVSSPQKAPVDLPMQVTLIDSAKKRKKPKRGSLVEKLQSAISKQVSFVRIWKHQMKQTMEHNTPVPCVTVYVQNCTIRFNRQFLQGIAVEDPFSLLPHTENTKSLKFIKIMVIPDIVGQIEMNSGGLVQLFSPWETLDHEELVLNVTYIRVVPENERDMQQYNLNIDPIKRSIVKDFDCPCINASKMISTCKDRSGKPNVIEKLVTGS